jgi:CheY-like chemotaxis protein
MPTIFTDSEFTVKPQEKNTGTFALIIDDQEIHAYAADIMLRKYGLVSKTVVYHSASEALDFLAPISNPENFPTYIFADIHMPEVTGFDFMDRYLLLPEDLRKNCTFIFLSSSKLPQDMEKLKDYQDKSVFLEKPLTREKIARVVR